MSDQLREFNEALVTFTMANIDTVSHNWLATVVAWLRAKGAV